MQVLIFLKMLFSRNFISYSLKNNLKSGTIDFFVNFDFLKMLCFHEIFIYCKKKILLTNQHIFLFILLHLIVIFQHDVEKIDLNLLFWSMIDSRYRSFDCKKGFAYFFLLKKWFYRTSWFCFRFYSWKLDCISVQKIVHSLRFTSNFPQQTRLRNVNTDVWLSFRN